VTFGSACRSLYASADETYGKRNARVSRQLVRVRVGESSLKLSPRFGGKSSFHF